MHTYNPSENSQTVTEWINSIRNEVNPEDQLITRYHWLDGQIYKVIPANRPVHEDWEDAGTVSEYLDTEEELPQ